MIRETHSYEIRVISRDFNLFYKHIYIYICVFMVSKQMQTIIMRMIYYWHKRNESHLEHVL